MTQPHCSLIFVNYHSAELLFQALDSWQQVSRGTTVEYVIINNDVSEREQIQALATTKGCKVEHLGVNCGFAKASNRGAQLASGEFLFFLNPDTRHIQGSLPDLLAIFKTIPRSLGGVRLINGQSQPERWSAGVFPSLFQLVRKSILGAPYNPFWERLTLSFPDWVSGAALIIPRSIFQELGGFDEDFFLYFEDVDLCRRAKERGMRVWRSPLMTVEHQGGSSHSEKRFQKQAYYASQMEYFKKHRSQFEAKILSLIHWLLSQFK